VVKEQGPPHGAPQVSGHAGREYVAHGAPRRAVQGHFNGVALGYLLRLVEQVVGTGEQAAHLGRVVMRRFHRTTRLSSRGIGQGAAVAPPISGWGFARAAQDFSPQVADNGGRGRVVVVVEVE
jgi:hypothetical protein